MQDNTYASKTIEICDLEYEVAGVGSSEAANSEVNLASFVLLFSLPAYLF